MRKRFGLLLAALLALAAAPARAELPSGFVPLREVAPAVRQDIRYAGAYNFLGRPAAGYGAAECLLAAPAATALAAVQAVLARRGLALIVWDCYRPRRAVADFLAWMRSPDARMRAEFYPRLAKHDLRALGYIAARSAHSSGAAVDLGIVPDTLAAAPAWDGTLRDCAAPAGMRFKDGTIDLGTGFDCFDRRADFTSREVGAAAQANRAMLREEMRRQGFAPYDREWWHFHLRPEPFPGRVFDFPIR